jgi:hypothetical protein
LRYTEGMRTVTRFIPRRLAALLLVGLLVLLAGCSGYRPPVYSPAEYPASYRAYDLTLYWKTVPGAGSLTIAGFVRNGWPSAKLDMELTATLLAADSRELGQGTFLFFPHRIDIDETVPFEITIPLKTADVPARLRYLYRYRVAENDDMASTFYQQVELPLSSSGR